MRTVFLGMLAVVGVAVAAVEAKAQVGAPAFNVTPKTNNNPPNQPPAGMKWVYATGTFTLAQGQVADKVTVDWYKQDGQNLIFAGGNSDPNPGNNKYTTADLAVDTMANGVAIKYTGIAKLYVVGNNMPVQTTAFTDYIP